MVTSSAFKARDCGFSVAHQMTDDVIPRTGLYASEREKVKELASKQKKSTSNILCRVNVQRTQKRKEKST